MPRFRTTLAFAAIIGATSLVVHGEAQQNRSRRTYGPGQCGPADPSYIQIANETGGQPFFLSPLELPRSAQVMNATSGSDSALVVWASGTVPGSSRDVPIPIDSTIRRITIGASFDTKGGTLTIAPPNGKTEAGITEDAVLNCGRVATIDAPPTGAWHARLTATGRYWLTAHARSDLDVVTSEFMREGGRPGHEGLFRIAGQPIAGEPATLRVVMTDEEVKSSQFSFVSMQGDTLGEVNLGAEGDHEFGGSVTLPGEPFRAAVTGLDATGAPYQRLHAGLFRAESVEVTMPAGDDSLKAGTSTEISCTIRNAGPPAMFHIIAADGRRYVKSVDPQEVTIATGASVVVKIRVAVPGHAVDGEGVDITVTASSETPRATTNGTTRHFTIAR